MLARRRWGRHLSDGAREAIAAQRPYPPGVAVKNPLTRNLCRRLLHNDWSAQTSEIDFDYTLDDEAIAGVPCVRYRTPITSPSAPVILYLHAGAFICGAPRVNAAAALPACHLSGCEGVGVGYSLAPEKVFPTQLEEIERVYAALVEKHGARRIVLLGDSAGATLVLTSLHRWKRTGLPLPAGAVAISPLADAFGASDTHITLKSADPLFAASGSGGVEAVFGLYAPGADPMNPEISPIEGSFEGLPPLLFHVGSREMLLGDSARLAEKARRAGVESTLRVFDGLFHLYQMHWSMAETKAAYEDIADFIRRTTS